ncbi:MAG: fumarylacetoacetate hydrolase family protein [Acidobacteria bacterium]|nr:fumarylacetoacetate hydrolase family protein [Acidobacteriota bacterium]
MRICRFLQGQRVSYGRLEQDRVVAIREETPFNGATPTGEPVPLSSVRLLAPAIPSKIVAVGRNYRAPAAELDHDIPSEPLLFMKAPSALLDPGEAILLPPESERVDHEGELVVVIGRRARRLPPEANPLDYVLGYTCGNDVTARDLQKRDGQFMRSKSFDTFAPVGPWIETALDPADVEVQTKVRGEVRQLGRSREMIFPVPQLIRYISMVMTLFPGDLIFTGTPAGVSPLRPGDRVEVEISGIGALVNTVALEPR